VARGSAESPASRFERLAYVEDPEFVSEGAEFDESAAHGSAGLGAGGAEAGGAGRRATARSVLPTRYYRDPSRTLLARNESPDVGFDVSLNPYRGCEHGCSYCLGPDTPILHADLTWRPIGDVAVGDALVGFDEFPEPGRARRLRTAVVERVWWSRRPTMNLLTRNGVVVTTPEHRWLRARAFRWSRTEQLEPGHALRRLPMLDAEPVDDDYRVGYVAGLSLGEGTLGTDRAAGRGGAGFPTGGWRIALADEESLWRSAEYLAALGVEVVVKPCRRRGAAGVRKLEVRSPTQQAVLHHLLAASLDTRSYRRGFVAGFADAEGVGGGPDSAADPALLERVRRYAAGFGFDVRVQRGEGGKGTLRILGRDADRLRFLGVFAPAGARGKAALFGRTPATAPEPVEKTEPGPVCDVVDIQTSTGTFYAQGLATHNCYARPTHEYLGLSAGLDFESHILVKEDAPELLAKTLGSPRWKPEVVAIGAVTDPYQPVERRLQLTRRCLRVFADFRNPCAIVTKGALVARDLDVLRELADHDCVAVNVSVTSLDDGLRRRLEPRASSPAARLRAVEALAQAGIPVGVMVAPIIPGLTDEEIPAIVEAAARAGARTVHPIVLRLPHGVADLFEAWLRRHVPERADKVMSRVRALRGGRRNDPRFHSRMRGEGVFADQIRDLFALACRRAGVSQREPVLSTAGFRRPGGTQLGLW